MKSGASRNRSASLDTKFIICPEVAVVEVLVCFFGGDLIERRILMLFLMVVLFFCWAVVVLSLLLPIDRRRRDLENTAATTPIRICILL